MSGSPAPDWQAPRERAPRYRNPPKTPLPAHYVVKQPSRVAPWPLLGLVRASRRLTREQLGAMLGVSGITIERWRSGDRSPPRDAVRLIWALSRYPGLIEDLLHIADVRDRHGRRLSKRAEDAVMPGWDDCGPRIKRPASRKKATLETPASP
jgi:hypothetical protein